jgi:hypothetical protein
MQSDFAANKLLVNYICVAVLRRCCSLACLMWLLFVNLALVVKTRPVQLKKYTETL